MIWPWVNIHHYEISSLFKLGLHIDWWLVWLSDDIRHWLAISKQVSSTCYFLHQLLFPSVLCWLAGTVHSGRTGEHSLSQGWYPANGWTQARQTSFLCFNVKLVPSPLPLPPPFFCNAKYAAHVMCLCFHLYAWCLPLTFKGQIDEFYCFLTWTLCH